MKLLQRPRWLLGGLVLAAALAGCGGSSTDSADQSAQSNTKAQGLSTNGQTSGAPAPAAGAPPASTDPGAPIGERVQPASVSRGVSPLKPRSASTHPTPQQIGLSRPSAELATLQKAAPAQPGIPTKIGIAREVGQTSSVQAMKAQLAWTATAGGGRVAAMRFSSEGAQGLRLGVLMRGLPTGSLLRFLADGSDQMFEVSAQQIFQTVQRNLDAGDQSDAARTYWSPNLGGSAVTMEVVLPPGAPEDGVEIAVPRLSHIFVDRTQGSAARSASGSCERDVACSSDYLPMSPSVALMEFVKEDGNGYQCTGTLMNDRASDGIPYFLTAAHCISSQTAASSLNTGWNYRKKSCGGADYFQGNGLDDFLFDGAALLTSNAATDATLLRLNDTPPPGSVFAASYATIPQGVDSVATVHHPKGDVQKVSTGIFWGTYRRGAGDYFSSVPSADGNANYVATLWSSGITESGSSGAPLFLKLNGTKYVIGQLFGGSSSCSNPTGTDVFGRFDKSLAAGMSAWLSPYSSQVKAPVYRFYNTRTRSHFYTMDSGERDLVITRFNEWSYEGTGFYAYGAQHQGTSPVYRFYSTQTGSHFFTMSESEKANILANFPWCHYQGIAWYANASSGGQSTPLYRFYNTKQGTHFFTVSSTERDYIIGHYSEWSYEGIAYQVWTGP